jgi:hypothetical protein
MPFLIVVTTMSTAFVLTAVHRARLAKLFLRMPLSKTPIAFMAAVLFAAIEEAAINVESGTLVVLLATVPVLAIETLIFGKVFQWFRVRRLRYPLVAFVIFGILFEWTVGGSSESFQSLPLGPLLLFGIAWTVLSYAFIAIVPFTILLKE